MTAIAYRENGIWAGHLQVAEEGFVVELHQNINGKAFQAIELLALLLLPLNSHSWGAEGVGVQAPR